MIIVSEYGSRYRLSSPRSECFTHSCYESFGGGYYCTVDLIVNEQDMTARMFIPGESCEFRIREIIR